jgi:hypothetical protein
MFHVLDFYHVILNGTENEMLNYLNNLLLPCILEMLTPKYCTTFSAALVICLGKCGDTTSN